MNNGLPGPSTTDTITGGKTLELSAYDRIRRPHRLITDDTMIMIGPRTLSAELTCPICLDLLTNTMTTKECLHRFCEECIKNALMRGNKECPTCRKKIVSKRSLRHDTNFDALISTIWPDRREYERMQEASLRLFQEKSNINALQQSIEAGMKAQAATRRMRVQGSYDYEKRRKRPAVSVANGASGSTVQALNNDTEEMLDGVEDNVAVEVDDDDVENTDATATTGRGSRDAIASSASETSETTEDTIESSEVSISASGQSEERSGASALSSPSHSSVQEAAVQTTRAKITQVAKRVTGATAKLPSTSSSLNDKMSKWLNENQKCDSPTLENLEDSSQSSSIGNNFQSRLLDMRRKDEEIEVELAPAKSLLKRTADVSPTLLHSWFISASPDITIGHIGEYLSKISYEKDETNISAIDIGQFPNETMTKDSNAEKTRPTAVDMKSYRAKDAMRPAYFYILNHNNQIRKIFLHETLYSAFITSQLVDDHMRIFYDTQPPDVNSSSRLVTEIVNEDFVCAANNSAAGLSSAPIKG